MHKFTVVVKYSPLKYNSALSDKWLLTAPPPAAKNWTRRALWMALQVMQPSEPIELWSNEMIDLGVLTRNQAKDIERLDERLYQYPRK